MVRARRMLEAGLEALEQGNAWGAALQAEDGLAKLRSVAEARSELGAALLSLLGRARYQRRAYADARAAFQAELEIYEAIGERESEASALAHERIALTYTAEKQYPQAATELERSISIRKNLVSGDPLTIATLEGELASVLLKLGRHSEVRSLVQEALSRLSSGGAREDSVIFQLQTTLAESWFREDPSKAVAAYTAAVEAASRHEAAMAPQLVEALRYLAGAHVSDGQRERAVATLERALPIAERHEETREKVDALARLLIEMHEFGEQASLAAAVFEKYATVRKLDAVEGTIRDVSSARAPSPAPAELPESTPDSKSKALASATVTNVTQVVGGMRQGFRACYDAELARQPWFEGSVKLTIEVGETGQVTAVTARFLGLPVAVVDCVLRHAAAASFEPPEGGKAVISLPVTFVSNQQ